MKKRLAGLIVLGTFCAQGALAEEQVVTLTQVPCQFLEPESENHLYQSSRAEHCRQINRRTGRVRLTKSKPLILKPGPTLFRVTNRNVVYPLGFYVRPANFIDRLKLPKASGGGLEKGMTKEYRIDLKPGNYLFSCPLNPTLDYALTVTRE